MSLLKHVTVKPWERKGVIGGLRPRGAFDTAPQRVALVFFLSVAVVLFSLFGVSYFIRMELADWRPLAEPAQLWLNTALLVLSSVLFQWARNTARRNSFRDGHRGARRDIFVAFGGGGLCTFLFIGGQLMVWESLQAAGHYLSGNPANAFFYLFTGLHGVHLLGGLWVWSKTLIRLLSVDEASASGADLAREAAGLRLSVELCALYWHFLLAVWLVLFAVLANT